MSWHPYLFSVSVTGCPDLWVTAFECDHSLDGYMEGPWSEVLIAGKIRLAKQKVKDKAAQWTTDAHALLVPELGENEWLPNTLCIVHLVSDQYTSAGGAGDFSVAVVGFFVKMGAHTSLADLFEAGLVGQDWERTAEKFDW